MVTVGKKNNNSSEIRLVIRCNAGKSSEYGTGHVSRSLNLIKFLSKKKFLKKVYFYLIYYTKDKTLISNILKKHSSSKFKIISLSSLNDEVRYISKMNPQIVIFDVLRTKKKTMQLLKKKNIFLLNLDDKGIGASLADVSISSLVETKYKGKVFYEGLQYLAIESTLKKNKNLKKKVKKIAVSFGGFDKRSLMLKFLEVLPNLPNSLEYMLFGNYQNIKIIKHTINKKVFNGYKIKIYYYPSNYYDLIKTADMGLVSGGLTMFDFLSIGIPSLAFPQYKHQLLNINKLEKKNMILPATKGMIVTKNQIKKKFLLLSNSNELRKSFFNNGTKVIDGNGLNRIYTIISNIINKY